MNAREPEAELGTGPGAELGTEAAVLSSSSSPLPPPPYAIELRGIEKRFGAIQANRAIDLAVPKGSIYGLVGENGAGKSTLMSILYGFYRADAGRIRVNGAEVQIASPRDALANGIGMVFQHLKLVPTLSVLDNVMLGAESGSVLAPGRAKARRLLEELGQAHGLTVAPDALVQDLPIGLQQRVEILKLLYRDVQILILDEPTDVLTPQETEQLFSILNDLRERGVTIILITHKLKEILALTDWVTVIRRGAVVGTRPTSATNAQELAELMVGRAIQFGVDKPVQARGARALKVRNLKLAGAGRPRLDDLSFDLYGGEVLGIAGVSGNGQTELLEVLAGMHRFDSGSVQFGEAALGAAGSGYRAATVRQWGVAHVPENRQRHGLIDAFSAEHTAILGYEQRPRFTTKAGRLKHRAIRAHCLELMQRYDVRPPQPQQRSEAFSGGNQQKLVLARELSKAGQVLLVGQPTRGVDVGAIEFIHKEIMAMRAAGLAILLVSGELDEILELSDRILVMFEGRLVAEFSAEEADERRIGLAMAGSVAALDDRAEPETSSSELHSNSPGESDSKVAAP